MKNQYVGDIGDYGKYAILREFANAGVKVGINWYLTENDGSNDGKFTKYLENDSMRRYCPEVFDALRSIAKNDKKTVADIMDSGIIPNAVFYGNLLKPVGKPQERKAFRDKWFEESIGILTDADLIFMDPDNGLLESGDGSKLGSEKDILPEEVERYYNEGHNVVYYCHKGRRSYAAWDDYISLMFDRIPDAKPAVLTYHKGSQRSYVFLIHEKDFVLYRNVIDKICNRWMRLFSEEFTKSGDVAGKADGEIRFEKSDGTIITLNKRADGRVQIKTSKEPNTSRILSVELFCQQLGIW